MKSIILCLLLFLSPLSYANTEGASIILLDTPRNTMRSFMAAMQDYKLGKINNDNLLIDRIDDAVLCLNLSQLSPLVRQKVGRETAIFLKEYLDRVAVINYSKIPNETSVSYWRLKGTEVSIGPAAQNDEADASQNTSPVFKFTPSTVARARAIYNSVQKKPYLKGSGQGALYKPPVWESKLPKWAHKKMLGLYNWQIIALFLSLLFGFMLKTLTEFLIILFKKITEKRKDTLTREILNSVERPIGLTVATGFWFSMVHLLDFEGKALAVFMFLVKISFSISLIWMIYKLCDVLTFIISKAASKTESNLDDQLAPLISKGLKVFIITFGILMSIQNLGFNVMSLMAGLGLGGLAFALAAKDTAANVFGSIMIVLDRPFKVGDWIKADNVEGTVEEIGFRSTRVRTFYKSVISIPNSTLVTDKIDNMGLRPMRRVVLKLGVIYQTTPEQIEAFLEGIKQIVLNNPLSVKEGNQFTFSGYGNFSLDLTIYYFLNVNSWADELTQRQNINLEILRLAERLDVQFAYPTQSLIVEQSQVLPKSTPTVEELKSGIQDFTGTDKLSRPHGLGIYTPPEV